MEEEVLDEKSKTLLREEQNRLISIIESVATLEKSEEWATLKELVFNRSLQSIERQIMSATLSEDIDLNKLYKLQGERSWAKKFTDTDRFIETLKKQLQDIKNRL